MFFFFYFAVLGLKPFALPAICLFSALTVNWVLNDRLDTKTSVEIKKRVKGETEGNSLGRKQKRGKAGVLEGQQRNRKVQECEGNGIILFLSLRQLLLIIMH